MPSIRSPAHVCKTSLDQTPLITKGKIPPIPFAKGEKIGVSFTKREKTQFPPFEKGKRLGPPFRKLIFIHTRHWGFFKNDSTAKNL